MLSAQKIAIAGPRDLHVSDAEVDDAIRIAGYSPEDVILLHGHCPTGVDYSVDRFAENNAIPVVRYPANWKAYGRAAGPRRNERMVKDADFVIIIKRVGDWSRGTQSTYNYAHQYYKGVYIHEVIDD